MKRLFVFIILLSGGVIGMQRAWAQSIPEEQRPEFSFGKSSTFDFEDVTEGPPAIHVFEFLNKGKTPLVISSASAACGCVVAAWTELPVLPGEKGTITVQYITDGRVGPFSKEIYIRSNAKSAQGTSVVYIKGIVNAKEPELPATGVSR